MTALVSRLADPVEPLCHYPLSLLRWIFSHFTLRSYHWVLSLSPAWYGANSSLNAGHAQIIKAPQITSIVALHLTAFFPYLVHPLTLFEQWFFHTTFLTRLFTLHAQ